MQSRFVCLWFAWLTYSSHLFADAAIQKIYMRVGQVEVISSLEDAELEASRKGIVQLEETQPGRWSVTALKPGFILLSFKREGILLQRSHIFVINTSPEERQALRCPRSLVCKGQHLITGESASFEDWLMGLAACRAKRGCVFDASLIEKGVTTLLLKTQTFFGEVKGIDYMAPDRLLVKEECVGGKTEAVRVKPSVSKNHWLQLLNLEFVCDRDDASMLEVTGSIVLLSRDLAEQLGISTARSAIDLQRPRVDLQMQLVDDLTKSRMTILAQPKMILRSGQTAKLSSGGEFKTMFANDQSEHQVREGWKRYGVELQVTPTVTGSQVQVMTELSLSSPHGAGTDSLQHHRMASDLFMPLDTEQLVGMTDLYSEMGGESQRSLLSKLPILGPLFTVYSKSDGQRILMYWLKVRKI